MCVHVSVPTRTTLTRRLSLVAVVALAIGAGCTFLVQFDDAASSDAGLGGDDVANVDDTSVGDDGAVDDVPIPPDGSNPCVGQQDGFNWASSPLARCCGGKPVMVNTDDNCGACGRVCRSDAGQSCKTQLGHWMCRGCANSNDCWSNCCSTSYMPFSCTPNSPCNVGTCSDLLCGSNAKCMTQDGGSNYCTYDF